MRALLSLRDLFLPAAARDILREEWELMKQIAKEEQARQFREDPEYRARVRQREILEELRKPNARTLTVLRRFWEAGKPGNWPPPGQGPANE